MGASSHVIPTENRNPILALENSRRKIKTEEKAKVVAVVWVTEFIQFLAVLSILDTLKNRMNCTRMI